MSDDPNLEFLKHDRDKLIDGLKKAADIVFDHPSIGPEDADALRQWMIDGAEQTVDRRRAAALAALADLERRADFYAEYIVSSAWKTRADAAKARAGYRCEVCNSNRRIQAHHRTYERLGDEHPEDITVLCDDCHELFHTNRRLKR